jgi:hypothetical protein
MSKALQLQALGYQNAIQQQNLKVVQDPSLWGGAAAQPQAPAQPQPAAASVPGLLSPSRPAADDPAVSDGGVASGAPSQDAPQPPIPIFNTQAQGDGPTPQVAPPQVAAPQTVTPQAPAPQSTRSPMNPSGMPPVQAQMWYLRDPAGYMKDAVAPFYTPTEMQKQLRAANIDPGSPQGQAALKASIDKANYIAPVAGRPGASLTGSDGVTRYNLPAPQPGAMWATRPDGTLIYNQAGQPYQIGIGGADAAARGMAAATAGGKAQYQVQQVWEQSANGGRGGFVNQTVANVSDAASGGGSGYGSQPPPIPTLPGGLGGGPSQGGSAVPLPSGPVPGSGAPQSPGAAPTVRGPMAAQPPLGQEAGSQAAATNLQNELSKKWTDLNSQNTQAQTTNSYLQNIKGLASQAATGQQSDRINYVNGLLSLAGDERATDAVTANNLLDKYSNQIVARLGTGGLGTDAARSILQSAYPNAHMTPQAINEAADNLMGANAMVQAKTRLLAPIANSRDPSTYNNTELKFDQNADPRIFQYANIKDATARQAFAKKLMQQDPAIVNKIRTLQQMGAF